MSDEQTDVVIIGGGPAGASAATFTARAGLTTVVIDADKGMTRRAMLNNHLGFPDGIDGPALVDQGRSQAERAGATWVVGTAEAVEVADGELTVRTGDEQVLTTPRILLATGFSVALAAAAGVTTTAGTEPHIKEVVVVDAQGRTSVPGIWAAGTAAGVSVHTIVTAGDGARVAINLISEIRGERWVDHDILPAG
ncbi:MAG TPA: FAD-dependent oxidoreductase [Iamia sp.]